MFIYCTELLILHYFQKVERNKRDCIKFSLLSDLPGEHLWIVGFVVAYFVDDIRGCHFRLTASYLTRVDTPCPTISVNCSWNKQINN